MGTTFLESNLKHLLKGGVIHKQAFKPLKVLPMNQRY